jgi:hypothetical protein
LQKPPRIYLEKSLEEILRSSGKPLPIIVNDECCPGDRDDNLWTTFNDYKPPETQSEWEQTCFLDKSFHGYYKWPKIIKYSLNKRERYTQSNMPKEVAILYDHFIDNNFIIRATQLMIVDEVKGEKEFDKVRCAMFKVKKKEVKFNIEFIIISLFRASFVILALHLSTISWINCTYLFGRNQKKNKNAVIRWQLK